MTDINLERRDPRTGKAVADGSTVAEAITGKELTDTHPLTPLSADQWCKIRNDKGAYDSGDPGYNAADTHDTEQDTRHIPENTNETSD